MQKMYRYIEVLMLSSWTYKYPRVSYDNLKRFTNIFPWVHVFITRIFNINIHSTGHFRIYGKLKYNILGMYLLNVLFSGKFRWVRV